jgi:hypothetical protein
MTRTIPMQLTWTEWWPVPHLSTEQELQGTGSSEEYISNTEFLPVPLELAGKFYQMQALIRELREALRAIEAAHMEVPKPPTRENRNNKRRLAKRGGEAR